jgi:NAD(P)-dependent dehydrogenase (short-subunit alcohol dehydrogenase family)
MELTAGKVAVVTGAASGIGLALAERFARAGLDVVLADIEEPALQAAEQKVAVLGAKTLAVPTDVSDEAAVNALAAAAVDRFGAVHVVCNNAGVSTNADPWSGPISSWKWVLGVNLWGIIHGIRAFLPVLAAQREGHIVNTASAAGLIPATNPQYDSTKHAVVAISEDLYRATAGLGVGVSVLCPGWVRTRILQADRNWPASLGEVPPPAAATAVLAPHAQRVIDEGMAPAAVADLVADAIAADRFWVFTDPRFTEMALDRWQRSAEGHNPQTALDLPDMPPSKQLAAEIREFFAGRGSSLSPQRCSSTGTQRHTSAGRWALTPLIGEWHEGATGGYRSRPQRQSRVRFGPGGRSADPGADAGRGGPLAVGG